MRYSDRETCGCPWEEKRGSKENIELLICYPIAPVTQMGQKGLKLFFLHVLMPLFTREEEDAIKFLRDIFYY